MVRSQRHISLDGGEVEGHALPMAAFAELLTKWDQALRDALPNLVSFSGLSTQAAREILKTVQPITAAPEPGSVTAAYGYGVVSAPADARLPFVNETDLGTIVSTFETGLVDLQVKRVVPEWMSSKTGRALVDACTAVAKRGIRLTFPSSGDVVLSDEGLSVLREFIDQEEHGEESELHVLGFITSVNVSRGTLSLDTAGHGKLRVTFPKTERHAVCGAMAEAEAVSVVVRARLSSDGQLHNAKMRAFDRLGPKPNYRGEFESLWGKARDVFRGVARDERGIPDPNAPAD